MANISISLEGIDQAIHNLDYRHGSVKHRAISAIRSFYESEESIKDLTHIPADSLISSIWDVGDDENKIRSKRRNFSSIKSSLNVDLEKLSKKGLNTENIIIAESNLFDMSEQAKNDLLNSFSDAVKTGDVNLDQATALLKAVTDFLEDFQMEDSEIDASNIVDQIKKILNKITDEAFLDEEDDEAFEEVELDEDEELEEIEDDDLEEIELDEDEELEEVTEEDFPVEEDFPDDEVEEIELEDDEELEVLEDDEDVEEIELDEDEELEEIEDDDLEEIELDEDEELEEVTEEDFPVEEDFPDDEVEEIELDDDEELEVLEDDEDVEEIELDDDEELEEIEDDDLEEIELDEDEELEEVTEEDYPVEEDFPDDEVEEIELDDDEELEVLEDDEDVEEIELDDDEELEEIEELDDDVDIIDLDEDEALEEVDELDEEEVKALEEFREKRQLAEQFDNVLGEREKKYNLYVTVPEGIYTIGTQKSLKSSLELQQFEMPRVYIAAYPVTNSLFEIFIDETGYVTSAEKKRYGRVYTSRFRKNGQASSWSKGSGSKDVEGANWYQPGGPGSNLHGKRNHPVVQVSVEDAMAFASWIGRRLPTEAEWEAAARTDLSHKYPWGNQFDPGACNIEKTGICDTSAVDQFDSFANAFNIVDMLGNVMEWTSDMEYPPIKSVKSTRFCIAKGAGWNGKQDVTISSRALFKPGFSCNTIGFRCLSEIFL